MKKLLKKKQMEKDVKSDSDDEVLCSAKIKSLFSPVEVEVELVDIAEVTGCKRTETTTCGKSNSASKSDFTSEFNTKTIIRRIYC